MSDLLQTSLAGIPLRNPVILAAGTCGTIDEMAGVVDLSRVGGLVSKSITRDAREGNPTWRIMESRSGLGMLNAIGLANPGIDKFEEAYLPRAKGLACCVIGSVAGYSVEDYVAVAGVMDEWGMGSAEVKDEAGAGPRRVPSIWGIELNVSCPNVKAGCDFGSSANALREVVGEVRKVVKRAKLIVKLSPWPIGLNEIAKAAVDAGADALTISNTMPAMAIDVRTRKPRLANRTGGLSGPSIHPIVVKLIHEVYTKVCKDARGAGQGVPIIGAGGVVNWEDAAEFILAGASAVQMGTALFADPRSSVRVANGLEQWVREQGCSNVSELVGGVSG